MEQIKGVYAAGLSVLDENLALDVKNTIKHAENVIDLGCHGVVFFGSTGQSQLISLSEKIQLINELPKSKYKNKFIIGTGLNSLIDTINLMKISKSMGFNNFLIMPPAYYKYGDENVKQDEPAENSVFEQYYGEEQDTTFEVERASSGKFHCPHSG